MTSFHVGLSKVISMFKLSGVNELKLTGEVHQTHLCGLCSVDITDWGIVLDNTVGNKVVQLQ